MAESKINTINDKGTFEDILLDSSDEITAIAYALRDLIAEVLPEVTEVPWNHQKTIGYGVGPKKMSEHFCYIAPHTAYVNLGFMYGADLPDRDGLLEGTGKLLRHIKVRSVEQAKSPAIKVLVEQASTYLPKLENK